MVSVEPAGPVSRESSVNTLSLVLLTKVLVLFATFAYFLFVRGVNRAGPNAGRAEQFYNLLEIRAGFLQSFTRINFLKILNVLNVRKTI